MHTKWKEQILTHPGFFQRHNPKKEDTKMADAFDISKLMAENGISVGTPGHRNSPKVEEITRALAPYSEDRANLVVTETGKVTTTAGNDFIEMARTQPEGVQAVQQVSKHPNSF